MIEVLKTEVFVRWLDALRDRRAAARILIRIERLERGNPGDVKPVGGGVSEMRVDHGAGYRIYLTNRGATVVILLCGGDKGSQRRDIERALALADDQEERTMTRLSRFDAAEHLKTPEDMAAYLDAALEEAAEDPSFFTHALGTIARAQNMSQLARDTGMTREGLYKALSEDGNPSFNTVMKVARALGLKLVAEPA